MNPDIKKFNSEQTETDSKICSLLASEICTHLPESESKIWHGHPVWFLDGNPIVGYNKLKNGIRLLFWSGQSFKSSGLEKTGSFMAAEKMFNDIAHIDKAFLEQWLIESREIQWDYKNIVKRKGKLEKLK